MHGVKRIRLPPVPDSAEIERKRLEKEAIKIKQYQELLESLYAKRTAQDYSMESLDGTTRVLQINPEFQTAWSIRRQILLNGILPSLTPEIQQAKLEEDLQLTNSALRSNPKNYSVWEHRKWVLETMPDADWGMEMKMVEIYLEKDGRNFHSWDYRRYLISSILSLSPSSTVPRTKKLPAPTTQSELVFTSKKIASNFSNFSAWHYRTKLSLKLWDEEKSEEGVGEETLRLSKAKKIDEEFDLVKQAIWSDPNDQSAWLYHRWLVGKGETSLVKREIAGIEELLTEEPDSRWCLDSLVYYKGLLVSLLDQEDSTREEREILNLDCLEKLKKLESVDPMRKCRYQDLAAAILPTKA